MVEDTFTSPKVYGKPPEEYRSYLGVPLRTSTGEIIGTICSFCRKPRHFTTDEIQLASIFAERAAAALENYELYRQLQDMNLRLKSKLKAQNPICRLFRWIKGFIQT